MPSVGGAPARLEHSFGQWVSEPGLAKRFFTRSGDPGTSVTGVPQAVLVEEDLDWRGISRADPTRARGNAQVESETGSSSRRIPFAKNLSPGRAS